MNDPLAQLEASKLVIKDLFRDFKDLLSKQKENGDKEFILILQKILKNSF